MSARPWTLGEWGANRESGNPMGARTSRWLVRLVRRILIDANLGSQRSSKIKANLFFFSFYFFPWFFFLFEDVWVSLHHCMIRGFCAFSACKEQETSNEARMFLYDGCLRCVASERLPVWHLVCSRVIYWTQIIYLESISINCISIVSSHFISLIHSYICFSLCPSPAML